LEERAAGTGGQALAVVEVRAGDAGSARGDRRVAGRAGGRARGADAAADGSAGRAGRVAGRFVEIRVGRAAGARGRVCRARSTRGGARKAVGTRRCVVEASGAHRQALVRVVQMARGRASDARAGATATARQAGGVAGGAAVAAGVVATGARGCTRVGRREVVARGAVGADGGRCACRAGSSTH